MNAGEGVDLDVLRDTVALAAQAAVAGGAPFGAAVVRDGIVVSLRANAVAGTFDPTAHAEVEAIRAACRTLGTTDLSGAVLYASCEPCPMCAASAVWAGIDRVVYAAPITALTLYPLDSLFPLGCIDWSLLPLTGTLVAVPESIALLNAWSG